MITDRGNPMYWENNLSQRHFVHHNDTLITVVAYKGFRGKNKNSVTGCLSYSNSMDY
jgi:hypothetical protein